MSGISSSPPSPPRPGPSSTALSEEDKLLRAVERAVERSYAAKKAANVSPWRRLFRKAIKNGHAPSKSKSASAKPLALPGKQQGERELAKKGPDVSVWDSSSVPGQPSEAGSEGDGVQVVQAAALDRSGYVAMMESAMARMQGADAGEAFAEMEQALKGLMDVSFKARDPPVLPAEFVSKCSRANKFFQRDIISGPLIMTSGYSIDRLFHQWSCTQTGEQLLMVPNHLLRDVITAWCLDHTIPPPSSTSTSVASEEAAPSVEQQEALQEIQLLSTLSKEVHPCLDQWQDLLLKLIGLHKHWKSTWTSDLEEKRLTIILNLSLHRLKQEILAKQEELPDALMEIIVMASELENPLVMVMVSSVVTILSAYDTFRRKVVEIGGVEMLGLLLRRKDALVRNEAISAILGLCTDVATALSHVPIDLLVECLSDGVITDESLLLLERTSDHEFVRQWIVSRVVLLMKVITQHGLGYVTSRGIQTAVGLIYHAVQGEEGRGRLEMALILPAFVEVLRSLKTKEMPVERVFQIDSILMIALGVAD